MKTPEALTIPKIHAMAQVGPEFDHMRETIEDRDEALADYTAKNALAKQATRDYKAAYAKALLAEKKAEKAQKKAENHTAYMAHMAAARAAFKAQTGQ